MSDIESNLRKQSYLCAGNAVLVGVALGCFRIKIFFVSKFFIF
jgi:hypothetical protein